MDGFHRGTLARCRQAHRKHQAPVIRPIPCRRTASRAISQTMPKARKSRLCHPRSRPCKHGRLRSSNSPIRIPTHSPLSLQFFSCDIFKTFSLSFSTRERAFISQDNQIISSTYTHFAYLPSTPPPSQFTACPHLNFGITFSCNFLVVNTAHHFRVANFIDHTLYMRSSRLRLALLQFFPSPSLLMITIMHTRAPSRLHLSFYCII